MYIANAMLECKKEAVLLILVVALIYSYVNVHTINFSSQQTVQHHISSTGLPFDPPNQTVT